MTTPEEKLAELGLELPPLRPALGDYVRCVTNWESIVHCWSGRR